MTPEEAWLIAMKVRFHRVLIVAQMTLPKWLFAIVGLALAIPGPQDELFVALVIGGYALFHREFCRDLKFAWDSIYHETEWIRHAI